MNLIDRMNEFKLAHAISMHVPGHKNNTIGALNEINLTFDMTEIPGLDNLHAPVEVLKELNNKLSKKYRGYQAQALVNGSTTGILSGLHALYTKNSKIYIVGDAHKSVHHATDLLRVTPIKKSLETLLKTEISPSDVVVFTYPTYEGNVFDIAKYIDFAHSKGAKVLVDEAHGAHFDITNRFPQSAMNFFPDIVVQSYHKGLPSLTGSSVIFVKNNDVYRLVMKYIDIFETSSPSYLSLLSIEAGQLFYETYDDEIFFLKKKKLIETLKDEHIEVKESNDPTKLLLNKKNSTPYDLDAQFRNTYIYGEMVTNEGVLWCLPLWHEGDTFPFERLITRIKQLESQIKPQLKEKREFINLSHLENKKAVRNIVPYPPGVPFMYEDEIFTERHLKVIMQHIKNNVKIEGLEDNLDYYTER